MREISTKPSKLALITLTYTAAVSAAGCFSPPVWMSLAGSALALPGIWLLFRKGHAGWAVLAAFFFLGMVSAPVSLHPSRDDISRLNGRRTEITGHVVSLPAIGEYGRRFVLQVESARVSGRVTAVSGKVQVFSQTEQTPEFGDRIRITGILIEPKPSSNPGQFSYRDYLARQRIFSILHVQDEKDQQLLASSWQYFLQRSASRCRRSMLVILERVLPPEKAVVLGSMVFGMQASAIPEEMEQEFRRSGTTHLLVVSGSQVMALVILLLWLARRLLIPPRIAAVATFVLVFYYALMTGAGSSVFRAAVAGILAAWAIGFSRETERWTLLSAAALFILLLNPMAVREIGFQLTFGAVIGILAFSGPIYRRIVPPEPVPLPKSRFHKMIHHAALLISVSISAQLTTAPLIAYHFQEFSPVGLIANLLAVPLSGLLVPLGLLTVVLGAVALPLGQAMGWIDGVVVTALVRWVQILSHLPGAFWILPPVSFRVVTGWYALLALVSWHPAWMTRERWLLLGTGVILIPVAFWCMQPAFKSSLRIYFLDVRQGSAALVVTPAGKSILIDGGPRRPSQYGGWERPYDAGEKVVLPAMKALGIRRLDLVASTGSSVSFAGGVPAVLESVPVRLLLLPAVSPGIHRIRDSADRRLIPLRYAEKGAAVEFPDGIAVRVAHVSPGKPESAVFAVEWKKRRVLVAGKLTSEDITGFLSAQSDTAVDVIRADWNTDSADRIQECLEILSPRAVIVSGATCPSAYRLNGINRFSTALNGCMMLESSGNDLRIQPTWPEAGEKRTAH